MIAHVWSILCSRAVIDNETNNISIQNVLERLAIAGEPKEDAAVPISFMVASLWTRGSYQVPEHGKARVTCMSPSGETLLSAQLEIDLSKHTLHRTRFGFSGLPVPEGGIYVFRVAVKGDDEDSWRGVAEVPLEVVFEPSEQPIPRQVASDG